MTMIPSHDLSKRHRYGGYSGGCGGSYLGHMNRLEDAVYDCCREDFLGSDFVFGPMAEDETRNESVNEAGSSSKDVVQDEGWLQLSIGGHAPSYEHKINQVDQTAAQRSRLIELDLLPGGTSNQMRSLAPIFHVPEFRPPRPISNFTPLFLQHPGSSSNFLHQENNWAFRPMSQNITAVSSSSSLTSLVPPGSYSARPFQAQARIDVPGPSLDLRVVDPPRRPHSGIWFMLQASQNQAKEPFLPQIPKSYLRIKDGRMTVRLLMKYLIDKLRLESESQIEITCRGQQLLPFLTLQHVRDNVWSPRDAVTLLPDSSTTDHLMVLHYGRTA